jgi:hypothetical protein
MHGHSLLTAQLCSATGKMIYAEADTEELILSEWTNMEQHTQIIQS